MGAPAAHDAGAGPAARPSLRGPRAPAVLWGGPPASSASGLGAGPSRGVDGRRPRQPLPSRSRLYVPARARRRGSGGGRRGGRPPCAPGGRGRRGSVCAPASVLTGGLSVWVGAATGGLCGAASVSRWSKCVDPCGVSSV